MIYFKLDWSLVFDSQANTFSNLVYILSALREESSQTNVILQYKLLAAILSTVCSVIQQS